MPIVARHLLPITEPRRRLRHRPGLGAPAGSEAGPTIGSAPSFEPASPARSLALVALGVLRRARRPDGRPDAWHAAAFGRDVDLIRTHLGPIGSRPVLAASFGRESFHGGWAAMTDAGGPVTVAYAIRWLELGDRVARPSFAAWLAESAPTPARRENPDMVLEPVVAG